MIFKNKIITKSLILSLFTSTLYIPSMAYEEIPNRYQTLEGEHIVIDDSTEGELHEIEIFGNTIQDENNLENIQSVGDLYIDEDGNPILDSQGREQYKVDIISSDYTHIKNDFSNIRGDVNNTTIDTLNKSVTVSKNRTAWLNSWFEIVLDEPVKIGDVINFSFYTDKPVNVLIGGFKSYIWYDNVSYSGVNQFTYNKIATNEFDTIRIQIDFPMNEEVVFTQLNKNYNNTTILLPTQLQKVGDVADKLYWDVSSSRYLIKKNIYKGILNGTDDKITENTSQEFTYTRYFGIDKYSKIMHNSHPLKGLISTFSKQKSIWDKDSEGIEDNGGGTHSIRLRISKDKILNGITNYLQNNPIDVYFVLKNPEYIETNITSKLVIPTFEDRTYIYAKTKNGINPTLKVTVDKLNRIAQDAVVEAEEQPTISKLSLARNIVNQMEESILKDQLQERLNNLFSLDDMQLERKTSSANLDIYIKSENLISLSIDTNSITFDNFGGVEDIEKLNAINLTVNSSLPYEVNAYLASEMQNNNKSNTMDKDILNIKANSEAIYNTFTDTVTPIALLDNQPKGNDIVHGIDIKLKGGIAHEKDVYKTTIKFEVKQK